LPLVVDSQQSELTENAEKAVFVDDHVINGIILTLVIVINHIKSDTIADAEQNVLTLADASTIVCTVEPLTSEVTGRSWPQQPRLLDDQCLRFLDFLQKNFQLVYGNSHSTKLEKA